MQEFDLIVIGTGAANIVADAAIEAGKRVALIEKDRWGGTCLNRGCLPTKVLTTFADYVRAGEALLGHGAERPLTNQNWGSLGNRAWDKIDENIDVLDYYRSVGAATFTGTAYFSDKKTITADLNAGGRVELTAKVIVLANGARTNIPNIEGLSHTPYSSSERFFSERENWWNQVPQRIVLLGGGTISSEFAHVFSALGAKVTILQRNVRLMPHQDEDISEGLKLNLERQNVNIELAVDVFKVSYENDVFEILYSRRTDHSRHVIEADMFFLAPGVKSNADTLHLDRTDVAVDDRNYIRSNEFLETTQEGIYALGDVNGRYQFRHMANYEAEVLAWNLYQRGKNPPRWVLQDAVPDVAYTSPQIASVGLNETEARARYSSEELEIGFSPYNITGKGFALGYTKTDEAWVKLIVHSPTKTILGASILGYEASSLIQSYIYLVNSRPRELEIVEPDIYTEFSASVRESLPVFEPQTWTSSYMDLTMTPHPSLVEVATWATEYLEGLKE